MYYTTQLHNYLGFTNFKVTLRQQFIFSGVYSVEFKQNISYLTCKINIYSNNYGISTPQKFKRFPVLRVLLLPN